MAQLTIASLSKRKEKMTRDRQQKEKSNNLETEKRLERQVEKERSNIENELSLDPSTSGLVPNGKRKERS